MRFGIWSTLCTLIHGDLENGSEYLKGLVRGHVRALRMFVGTTLCPYGLPFGGSYGVDGFGLILIHYTHMQLSSWNGVIKSNSQIYCCHGRVAAVDMKWMSVD